MEKLKHFKSPCYHHGELSPRERITLPLSEIGPDTDKVIDCRASKTGAMLFRKWLQFEGKYKIKHQLTSGPKFQIFLSFNTLQLILYLSRIATQRTGGSSPLTLNMTILSLETILKR